MIVKINLDHLAAFMAAVEKNDVKEAEPHSRKVIREFEQVVDELLTVAVMSISLAIEHDHRFKKCAAEASIVTARGMGAAAIRMGTLLTFTKELGDNMPDELMLRSLKSSIEKGILDAKGHVHGELPIDACPKHHKKDGTDGREEANADGGKTVH